MLQFISHDHLGKIRMVLTEKTKIDYYPAATLEGNSTTGGKPNALYTEKGYYTTILQTL